jgi:hypothetical protein
VFYRGGSKSYSDDGKNNDDDAERKDAAQGKLLAKRKLETAQ